MTAAPVVKISDPAATRRTARMSVRRVVVIYDSSVQCTHTCFVMLSLKSFKHRLIR